MITSALLMTSNGLDTLDTLVTPAHAEVHVDFPPSKARSKWTPACAGVTIIRVGRRWLPVVLVLSVLFVLPGCERGVHDMYEQPRYTPLQPSPLFDNGNSSQAPPAGTVPAAAGAVAGTSSGRRGQIKAATIVVPTPVPVGPDGQPLIAHTSFANPLPITIPLLERGQQRYNIYCAPCHGRDGAGNGMVVRHGFPAPPSFHAPRLRLAADSHFFEVISHGYGVMYPYAGRVQPRDRWAIVAYIRALQLSRHASVTKLSNKDRRELKALARAEKKR